MSSIKGGAHLGVVRRWMQRSAVNGDTVTWGSNEELHFFSNLTPAVFEQLAQDIADAVLRENMTLEQFCVEVQACGVDARVDVQPRTYGYSIMFKTESGAESSGTYLRFLDAMRGLLQQVNCRRGKVK